ncbi:MAG: nucleoside deaminase [Prevotellaceae bacterium]|nr:nucleoside deaminase [Prevotellaceae bacterium]
MFSDEYFMREALKEAQKAFDADEVPIGAVLVWNNKIIARGHNLTETLNDPTAHAEIQIITAATNHIGGKYLNECTLYATLEPCVMCAGACYWAQLGTLVYGAADEKRGVFLIHAPVLHPRTIIKSGILAEDVTTMLTNFFKKKRKK